MADEGWLSEGWREEIEDLIENYMSMDADYNSGYRAGLRKALEIIDNHL